MCFGVKMEKTDTFSELNMQNKARNGANNKKISEITRGEAPKEGARNGEEVGQTDCFERYMLRLQ